MTEDTAMPNVFAPEDIVWQRNRPWCQNFWISDELVGNDYSTLFSAH